MNKEKTWVFAVYLLDVFLDESGWQENQRFHLGELEIEPVIGKELDDVDILTAMRKFSYQDFTGRRINALITTDRRKVYAEDCYGDGTWWEIGSIEDRVPVYGLKLRENAE